jgi:DNA-binding SARP family transcriptional activator/tetratricopeptide (TPR) repeat protein
MMFLQIKRKREDGSMLTIRILGTPQILLDGMPVALPFKRAEALLYYLAVERSASRQELIALLWESDDETKGRKNLRHALYTLKKELGGDVLISHQKSMVVLNAQWEIDCDYDRFVRQGEEAAYGGSFLAGFAVRNAFSLEEWILRTRENLHNLHLNRLEKQAKALREKDELEGACSAAINYLAEDPYDETMAAFLMECYRERRQYTRAAQVYQKLKKQLSQELGVDPLETTTIKYYEILNQWNDAARQPNERADHAVPAGREKIYDALRAATLAFAETATRRSSQLLIGESGSGKSEVLNHFLRVGEFQDLLVVRTECLQSERETALSVWRQIVRQILEFARQEQVQIPKLFREDFPGESVPDGTVEDAVILLLSQVGRKRKILLILEDLQCADQWSVELLATLLRRLERGALMAVLSMTWGCPRQTMGILEQLEADEILHRQVLMPLSRQNTDEFLQRELGPEAAEQLSNCFYQESGGNLRLLANLVQTYDRTGDVHSTLESLGEFLLKRLRGLSEDALRVTQLLSLSSRGASVKILQELIHADARQLSEILLNLRQRAIAEEYVAYGVSCCRFLHPKLRELVYEQLTAYQRQELHGQMAALLADSTANPTELLCWEIAWHYEKVGQLEACLDFELKALELETRWRCTPFVPWPKEREVSLESLEKAADRTLGRLMRLQQRQKRELTSFCVRLDLIRGRISLFRGDWDQAVALLGNLTASDPEGNRLELARICSLLAGGAYSRQSADLAERYVTAGLRFLKQQQDDLTLARLYQLRGNCFGLRGDYDRALYYLQETVELLSNMDQSGEVRCVLASAYADLGRIALCRNDFSHADPWYKKALGLLNDADCVGKVWVLVHYGRTVFAVDNHIRAKDLFREAYSVAQKTGEPWGRTAAGAYCAYFAMAEDDEDDAVRILRKAAEEETVLNSPMERGILDFVRMKIRRRLDLEQRQDSALTQLLSDRPDDYARRGVRLCGFLPDIFEIQMLSKDLRDGISTQLRYRSSELYSKNKRFMSE